MPNAILPKPVSPNQASSRISERPYPAASPSNANTPQPVLILAQNEEEKEEEISGREVHTVPFEEIAQPQD